MQDYGGAVNRRWRFILNEEMEQVGTCNQIRNPNDPSLYFEGVILMTDLFNQKKNLWLT